MHGIWIELQASVSGKFSIGSCGRWRRPLGADKSKDDDQDKLQAYSHYANAWRWRERIQTLAIWNGNVSGFRRRPLTACCKTLLSKLVPAKMNWQDEGQARRGVSSTRNSLQNDDVVLTSNSVSLDRMNIKQVCWSFPQTVPMAKEARLIKIEVVHRGRMPILEDKCKS